MSSIHEYNFCVYMYMYLPGYVEARVDITPFQQLLCILFFEIRSLIEPGVMDFDRLAGQ